MLTTGHQNAAQNSMGFRSVTGPIAPIGFAGDDGRPQHVLGQVIGGVQFIHIQETQQMGAMFAQAFGKTGIIGVFQPALRDDQGIQLRFQGLGSLGGASIGIQVGSLAWLTTSRRSTLAVGRQSTRQL